MPERTTKIILEIVWDDAICDHPMGWDWEFLLCTKINRVQVIDPEGEGLPSEGH